MMGSMQNRVITAILVLFIPIALIGFNWWSNKTPASSRIEPILDETESKLTEVARPLLLIDSVEYATPSGMLTIRGQGLGEGYGVFYTWAIFPKRESIPEITYSTGAETVRVAQAATRLTYGGMFSATLPIYERQGVVEVLLIHSTTQVSIRYDLEAQQLMED
jgi:hypothetical protein